MSHPYFFSALVTNRKACHKIEGKPATHLIIKSRGEWPDHPDIGDVELSLENGDDGSFTFLVRPGDSWLRLGPSEFHKICYRRLDHGAKVRLDIAVLR